MALYPHDVENVRSFLLKPFLYFQQYSLANSETKILKILKRHSRNILSLSFFKYSKVGLVEYDSWLNKQYNWEFGKITMGLAGGGRWWQTMHKIGG